MPRCLVGLLVVCAAVASALVEDATSDSWADLGDTSEGVDWRVKMMHVDEQVLLQTGAKAGVRASPVRANPPPRDYYKIPDKIQQGGSVQCEGLLSLPIAAGNLEACAKTCTKCGSLCRGFVDDGDNGVCAFKGTAIKQKCLGDKCHTDGYMKCPAGTWSDGYSTNMGCFAPAFGYVREIGTGPWNVTTTPSGVAIACNKGDTFLDVPSNNLGKCASMCRKCNIGGNQCEAFIRVPSIRGKGSTCMFKSFLKTGSKIGSVGEAYRVCKPGLWSDGISDKCSPAPAGFSVRFGKDGGNVLGCRAGSPTMKVPADGDLNKCAKVCQKCEVGIKKCNGFVVKDSKCHFMTASTTSKDNIAKILGGTPNKAAATYFRCGPHEVSSGSDAECQRPKDFQITVSTGAAKDCTCNERAVAGKRFSAAKWSFDVLDGQDVPLFVKGQPFIQAPCANAEDKNCKRAVSANFTAEAGSMPTSVRISADQNDDWCMKTFCMHSSTLKKRWVPKKPQPNYSGQVYMNPGVTRDGECAPPTTSFPQNNWGWCRFISATDSKTTQASLSTCNSVQDYKKAFWRLELVQEDGDCSNIPAMPVLTPQEKKAAEVAKAAAATAALLKAQVAAGPKPVVAAAAKAAGAEKEDRAPATRPRLP